MVSFSEIRRRARESVRQKYQEGKMRYEEKRERKRSEKFYENLEKERKKQAEKQAYGRALHEERMRSLRQKARTEARRQVFSPNPYSPRVVYSRIKKSNIGTVRGRDDILGFGSSSLGGAFAPARGKKRKRRNEFYISPLLFS